MSHHRYLAIIASAGILSWIAWVVVINKLDPFESTGLGLGLFYISLFLALVCSFTVVGFYFRVWLNKNEIYYDHINIAFRQGMLLTVIALGCLTFQLLGVLTWWSGLLLIGAVTMVEFYFMARQQEY
jgi:Na+/melibiose symporter-like transporter